MSHKIYLSGHLKSFSNGRTEIALTGSPTNVGELLAALWLEYPPLRDRILTEQGEIRPHVNVYYQNQDIRRLNGLQTDLDIDGELHIFNAVSGG